MCLITFYEKRALSIYRLFIIMGCLLGLPQNVLAFDFVPTEIEFMAMSDDCKAIYSITTVAREHGFGHWLPKNEREKWRLIGERNGGAWHYCGGLVKLRRAELALNVKEKERNYRDGISAVKFSYNLIDLMKPMAADMAIAIARGYRGLHEIEKAKKYLDVAIRNHPNKTKIYSLYGLIYFDAGNYEAAKEVLLKGNEVAKGRDSEILYFLGLVSIELGEIDEAKEYAYEAYKLGYPLKGLKEKLDKLGKY